MHAHVFDEEDHLALQQAAQLVNEVIERNRPALTMKALAFLCDAIHDMDMAEKYMMPTQREGEVA